MKDYIDKICKLQIKCNERVFFYTAKICSVNDTHISFIDKFGLLGTYKISDVIQIYEVKPM